MDKLLELLKKHNCHLKRGSQNMAEFLDLDFQAYIYDIRQSIDVKDNALVGAEMCSMVDACIDEISDNASRLVEVLRLYNNGRIVEATLNAFKVFDIMKPQLLQRYSGAYRLENYYRIREIGKDSFPLERRELFHIPIKKNYLIGSARYSMPGQPCLYLSSQTELAWYECGMPCKFAIAEFSVPQEKDNHLKFVDFSEKLKPLMYLFVSWFHNEKDKLAIQKYLLKYIYCYPLRAACSVVVEHPGAKFIEEYVISQLLLQWIRNDKDFDGVRYESCSNLNGVRTMGGHNIVLVTKQFDTEGYDIKLRECITVGLPKKIDLCSGSGCASNSLLWDGVDDFQQI